jgi:hypothetical protein
MGAFATVCSGAEKHRRFALRSWLLLAQIRNPITANRLSIMHKEGLSERLRLRITPKLEERLKRWAERNDTSVSAYVRQALQEKINDEILSDINRKL